MNADEEEVVSVVNRVFVSTDGRDWPSVRSCFAESDRIAYHCRRTRSERNTRVFARSYDFGLKREGGSWKVHLFRFKLKFVDGNPDLEKEA